MAKEDLEEINRKFRVVSGVAVVVLSIGSIFYHIVEKLNWVDSLYFSVITLATVGYGDITPQTGLGKIFTIFYVITGIGIIAVFANLFIKRAVIRHETRQKNTPK